MKRIVNILIILFLLNLVCACYSERFSSYPGMPKPPKTGPQEYLVGWQDGCSTGMTSYSSDYLRSQYKTRANGEMMRHPYYQKGWEVGQSYCSYYLSTYLSNHELASNDLRSSPTWYHLKHDKNDLFSYTGIAKMDGIFKEEENNEDIPLLSFTYEGLIKGDATFFN